MSSRWKKVWADFWGNRTRTFLTILIVMVGTFGVGFINNFSLYMIQGMDEDFLSASPSEALIYAYPMDDRSVRVAREVPGVNAAEARSVFVKQVIQSDGKTVNIQFTAIESPYTLTVNTLQPMRGESRIAPLGDKEVLIDVSADSLGYKPGDTILIDLGGGKQRKLRLAGYFHAAAGFPYGQTRIINAYVTPKTMKWLGGTLDYNTLEVSVAENPTDQQHVTQVAQAVAERIKETGASVGYVQVSQPGHHFAYTYTQIVVLVMRILGWLIVILSGFLIVNTITALMAQQTRQIGIMKATGAETWQIFGMYIVLILGFGLIALIIAIPLANIAAEYLANGMAAFLSIYLRPFPGYTATIVQQAIVALVVPPLAALLPVYNSVRVTVREALTDYGLGGSFKPRKSSVSRRDLLIPRPMRLSLRNAFRRKARLSLTLFTLVLAGAIFIAVNNLQATFYKLIDDFKGYYLADVDIGFERPYRFEKVASVAEQVEGVEGVEGWMTLTGTLIRNREEAGAQVSFLAPPSTSTLIQPNISYGRWLKPGDQNAIVISDKMVRTFPDLNVGDWLTIEVEGKEAQWQIVGIYTFVSDLGIYVNYEYLSRFMHQPEQVYLLRVMTSQHDIGTQQRVSEQLQTRYAEAGIRVSASQLGGELIQATATNFDIFIYFIMAMAVLIAVVGALGLMGTMSINVMERTREIGVLRAIGASSWDIQSIVIVEGIVIGLISWIISILLSIPITSVLTTGVGMQFWQSPMPFVYNLSGIFIWLFGILVIGTIASALPARHASRLTVKDTLAYEG
jgi:putative ABC transport system permease protein